MNNDIFIFIVAPENFEFDISSATKTVTSTSSMVSVISFGYINASTFYAYITTGAFANSVIDNLKITFLDQ